ncbi:MAG TPA: Bcr/CflA family efflux MFS transporter [Coxiellaceae bacterium]|nr:Bcr/CflA family efflux MFS transporter [Coxiellaceae bacterium]
MENTLTPTLTEKHTKQIVWTLLCLMPIIGMAIDVIAPSLPAISSGLSVSSMTAKNIIAIFLLGYALGNFFTGFLTDAKGRQKLIRINLLGFVIVSVIPIIFQNINALLLCRLLQGFTIGATSVLLRAILTDILPPEKLTSMGTLIGAMWGIGPVFGPVIGGYLQFYFGWTAGFYFLAIMGLIGFISTWFIVPETHFNRHPLELAIIKKNIAEVIHHRMFMAVTLLMGITYSLMIVFSTAGPFLIQKTLHYSPVFFGHVALILGIVFVVSTFICRRLLKKFLMENLLLVSIHLFLAITILSVIAGFYFSENIYLAVIASALMFFACGSIYPMSMGKGLSFFRHISGTATAIMYLINILLTSLISFIVSLITVHNNVTLMLMYFILMLCAAIVYWSVARNQ